MTDAAISPDFSGKVLFVTGAAMGFGAAFARAFAAAGATAVVTDLNLEGAEAVAAEIVAAGGKAFALRCDVADENEVDRAFAEVIARAGGVDFLINNAGLHLTKYSQQFDQLTRAEIRALLDVNVMGVINCTLAAKASMAARGGGVIVNISSIAGYLSTSPYAISKLAVRGLTVAFAAELGAAKIRVNAIAPGLIATDSALADLPAEMFTSFANQYQQLKRRGEVEDIVNMAMFLCSPAASFVTGETIKVAGGYPMNP